MNFKKLLLVFGFLFLSLNIKAQAYLDDIMFQSFGWDEYAQSRISSDGGFYEYMNSRAGLLKAAGFDMIWLPPPSKSSGGVGYIPTEWYNFSQTSWGSEAQMVKMLATMNAKGLYPIADIVVNHRSGSTNWTDFTNPTWDCSTICYNDDGGYLQTPAFTQGCKPTGANDTGEDFSGGRDLDHTNLTVQNGVKDYLALLKTKGFKGWRWDVTKGFSAQYFGMYINASAPYYSVGEYWDGNVTLLKNWIDGTNVSAGNSGSFDFTNYYQLDKALNQGNQFSQLNWSNAMAGLAGQFGYASKGVTFVDNHDTFVKSSAMLGDNIMKAYAYILTHPGIPCVFAPHYYGGTYTKDGVTRTYIDNSEKIKALMKIRKDNGINANSVLVISNSSSFYSATIDNKVAMKIGPGTWSPAGTGWILNTSGTDYAVWTKAEINTPPTVLINPASGLFTSGTTKAITITASDASGIAPSIRYTTDGSEPTANSTLYTGSFNVSSNTVVKAIAIDNLGLSSGAMEREYKFATGAPITVYFKPPTTLPAGAVNSWIAPKIHYWSALPNGVLNDAVWGTPVVMTAVPNLAGWYSYTFNGLTSINFLFRNGEATGTTGVTKTCDKLNVTSDKWYEWSTTEPTCFIKEVAALSNENFNKINFSLSPNPTKGQVTIDSQTNFDSFELYNITGSLILKQKINSNIVDLSSINHGIYLIKLNTSEGEFVSQKLIKE